MVDLSITFFSIINLLTVIYLLIYINKYIVKYY